MITSRPVEVRTVMPPWNNDTLTVPGRDGSLNGTVSRFVSDCAWMNVTVVNNTLTKTVPKAVRFMMLTLLVVPTQYMYVAVYAFECDLRAATPDAHGGEPIAPVDE